MPIKNYINEIYDALDALFKSQQVKDFFAANGLDAIKYVAYSVDQFKDPENFNPFDCPALFFDVENVDWAQRGKKRQTGAATIALYVVQKTLHNTAKGGGFSDKTAKMLAYPDIINQLITNLLDTNNEYFGSWQRIQAATVQKDKAIYVFGLKYRVTVTDNLELTVPLVSNVQGKPDAYSISKY